MSLSADKLCVLSGHFVSANGTALAGVRVKFTPDPGLQSFQHGAGVALDAETVSGADGLISLSLIQGTTGLLSVAGLGIVRHVTIPLAAQITLPDLIGTSDDLLEVQKVEFTTPPRNS